MATKQRPGPDWFDLRRYDEAADIGAGGWLLNLIFRGWVARTGDAFGVRIAQGRRPVLRGGDAEQIDEFSWRFMGANDEAPSGLLDLLKGRPLRSGIDPLAVEDLYLFEGKLPDDVRRSGARYVPGGFRQPDDPPAFFGRLDHAFNPQYLGRFVRINLALPDSVLLHDLSSFLRRERAELAAIGGVQPYIEAVRLADK